MTGRTTSGALDFTTTHTADKCVEVSFSEFLHLDGAEFIVRRLERDSMSPKSRRLQGVLRRQPRFARLIDRQLVGVHIRACAYAPRMDASSARADFSVVNRRRTCRRRPVSGSFPESTVTWYRTTGLPDVRSVTSIFLICGGNCRRGTHARFRVWPWFVDDVRIGDIGQGGCLVVGLERLDDLLGGVGEVKHVGLNLRSQVCDSARFVVMPSGGRVFVRRPSAVMAHCVGMPDHTGIHHFRGKR